MYVWSIKMLHSLVLLPVSVQYHAIYATDCKMKHLTSRASTGKEGRLWLRLSLCFECGTAYNIMRLHWLVVEQQRHVCVHSFRGPCSNQDLRQTQTIKAHSIPRFFLIYVWSWFLCPPVTLQQYTSIQYCIITIVVPFCIDYTLQHCYCYYLILI